MKKVFANWTYSPKNYFESEISVEEPAYSITIKNGNVELVVNSVEDDGVIEIHSRYNSLVESFFMAELLNKRKSFELKPSTLKIVNADGNISQIRKEIQKCDSYDIALEVIVRKLDKNGKVTYDSKEEQKKRQAVLLNKLQNAIQKDGLVKGLFESYKNSISDTDNELVHLYEIQEALKTHFGSKAKALNVLGIINKDWSDLGRICNELPLKEGRHRGQMKGQLRNASEDELRLARKISTKLISAYIDYLNDKIE